MLLLLDKVTTICVKSMPPPAISVGNVSVPLLITVCEICEASIMEIFHIWEICEASIPHVLKADGKTSVMNLIKTRGG